jgi:hypothetical protein
MLVIGAKVAAPEKFCVNFMGDAAFGMTGLDFETAVRSGIPILTVVLNNSTMAIEIPHMKLSHEKHKARDLGGWSERVEDPGEIANAFRRARRQTEEGQRLPAGVHHQRRDGILAPPIAPEPAASMPLIPVGWEQTCRRPPRRCRRAGFGPSSCERSGLSYPGAAAGTRLEDRDSPCAGLARC